MIKKLRGLAKNATTGKRLFVTSSVDKQRIEFSDGFGFDVDFECGDDADFLGYLTKERVEKLLDVVDAAESCVKSTLLPAECYRVLKETLEVLDEQV